MYFKQIYFLKFEFKYVCTNTQNFNRQPHKDFNFGFAAYYICGYSFTNLTIILWWSLLFKQLKYINQTFKQTEGEVNFS